MLAAILFPVGWIILQPVLSILEIEVGKFLFIALVRNTFLPALALFFSAGYLMVAETRMRFEFFMTVRTSFFLISYHHPGRDYAFIGRKVIHSLFQAANRPVWSRCWRLSQGSRVTFLPSLLKPLSASGVSCPPSAHRLHSGRRGAWITPHEQ